MKNRVHEPPLSLRDVSEDSEGLDMVPSFPPIQIARRVASELGPQPQGEGIHSRFNETMLSTKVTEDPRDFPLCLLTWPDVRLAKELPQQAVPNRRGHLAGPEEANPSCDHTLEPGHLRVKGAPFEVQQGNSSGPFLLYSSDGVC